MTVRTRCAATAASLLWLATAAPGAAGQGGDAPTASKYREMPWHLVDLYWDLAEDAPFESYSVDVTLAANVPESVNLYVAPIGLGRLSGTQFYGGLQTQADGYTKSDQQLRKIGRGMLFSMWGERGLDAIRPADGGYCQSSGHEGDFVSVRRPFEWTAGTYTYRLVSMDCEESGGEARTWVGAFLHVHATDENIFIGALRFPGEDLVLAKNNLASFVEAYGRAIPVERIPRVDVTLGNLRVNGQPANVSAVTAVYPEGVPDYADAVRDGGSVVVTLGQPVEDRVQRTVPLPALPAEGS
jgi:hypothetical protein